MATLSMDGIEFDVVGEGPSILFVPGSYSTGAAWRPIQKLLPPHYRMASTSLCGYGATPETRSADDYSLSHNVRVVAHAMARLPGPVLVIGHSYGAMSALAAALENPEGIAAMVLFEPPVFDLLERAGQSALVEEAFAVVRRFEQALAAGEADGPAHIVDYWGGPGSYAALPAQARDYFCRTAPSNALDWKSLLHLPLERLATLQFPVLVARGERSNAAMAGITEALSRALPRASHATIDGAGHFLISTHPAQCAELLAPFLRENAV